MRQLIVLSRPVIIILSLTAATVFIIFYLISPITRNESSYVAASLDKEHRLETVESSRIIFVGGSNLALGINCHKISEETKLDVINMGLHAGLGLNFILNETKAGVRPGDIIILSIEYFLEDGNKKLMAQLTDVNPQALEKMDLSLLDKIRLLVSRLQLCLSSAFYKFIGKENDPIYYREGFDKFGDLKTHFHAEKPAFPGGSIVFKNNNYNDGIRKINEFISDTKSKGAIVYFTYPAFQRSTFNLNKAKLKVLDNQYRANLKCLVLGNMEMFVFDDRNVFDTVYHLDSVGIQKRTDNMLQLLKKVNVNKQRTKV